MVIGHPAARSFESLAVFDSSGITLTGRGQPARLEGTEVSATFFDTLRVRPAYGRTFAPGENEPGHAKVAVLGNALWRARFAGDPAVVGRARRIVLESGQWKGRIGAKRRHRTGALHDQPDDLVRGWVGQFDFDPELDLGQDFNNSYEQSKFEAEQLVRSKPHLPATIMHGCLPCS